MEIFTLLTQVSSQSDHPDACTGQMHKDLLISAYERKCLEKGQHCNSSETAYRLKGLRTTYLGSKNSGIGELLSWVQTMCGTCLGCMVREYV